MDKVRIGILGFGNMGSQHARFIRDGKTPELRLTAVADTNPERLSLARSELGETVSCFDSAEAMFECGLLDAALIAVPHYDHPRYAMAALARGLHVMVEKPAGVYTKQVREMNEAFAGSGKVFGLMYNQRTDHIYRKMRELVQGGTLGALRRSHWVVTDWYRPAAYYSSATWRATWHGEGGGVLLNQCPHNLDLWQWICGMPCAVQAQLHYGKWHSIEVEDDVSAYVEYPGGATGVFVTSTGDTPGTNRFEVTMEKGKLVAENGALTLWELDMSEPEFSRMNTKPFAAPPYTKTIVETDGESPQHPAVLNAFAAAILRGEPLIAAGEEGINGLMLSNAMHLSSWLGRKVTVPLDEELFYKELAKRAGF